MRAKWGKEGFSLRRALRLQTVSWALGAAALCLFPSASAESQESTPKVRIMRGDQGAAALALGRAQEVIDQRGPIAAVPAVRSAAAATRKWLVSSGQMTPERDRRLTYLEHLCESAEFTCDDALIEEAPFELRLLVDLDLSETPFNRAVTYFLTGRHAMRAKGMNSVERAQAAERAFTQGADILLAKLDAGKVTREEASMLLSLLAMGATSAYESGDCERARNRAGLLIDASEGFGPLGVNYSPIALGLSILGACHLWNRDPDAAYAYATAAIKAEGTEESNRSRTLAGLDLRARYANARAMRIEPREIGSMAAVLRWRGASPEQREKIFADLVRWSSESRASTLSDAIVLSAQARTGSAAIRDAVAALLDANAQLDMAKRDLNSGVAGAQAAVDSAAAQLIRAQERAFAAGVRVPSPAATIDEIRGALAKGQGFVFLFPTQFGAIVWGVDANGEKFVMPPSRQTVLLVGNNRERGEGPTENLIASVPPALYFADHSIGWDFRFASTMLAHDPRWANGEKALARYSATLAIDFGASLNAIKGRARYWAIAHTEELDGVPIAQIPLVDEDGASRLLSETGMGLATLEDFPIDKAAGMTLAYAVVPTPRAFVALAQVRRANRDAPEISYLGIGDVPFAGTTCGLAQAARAGPGTPAPSWAARRSAILNQNCLSESHAQLAAFGGTGGGRLLVQKGATESSLSAYRGKSVGILAFSTHGLPADTALTGEWPGLLLFPPERERGAADDGVLTSLEAAQLGIQARLVVLSACSTGVEDLALGEEPLAGMARGFFLGGAQSALVTRWELNAAMGVIVNKAFAHALKQGESRAEALLAARRALLAKQPRIRPWQWSVIELIGDGSPL